MPGNDFRRQPPRTDSHRLAPQSTAASSRGETPTRASGAEMPTPRRDEPATSAAVLLAANVH
jgi:hypothetical protein